MHAIAIGWISLPVLWTELMASSSAAAEDRRVCTGDAFGAAQRYTIQIRGVMDTPSIEDEEGGNWTGAEFVVDRQRGWILTNAHVASYGKSPLEVAFRGGEFLPTTRRYVDSHLDLAVLEIDSMLIPE